MLMDSLIFQEARSNSAIENIITTQDAGNSKEILLDITSACRVVLEDVDRRHEKMFQDFTSILGEMKEANYEVVKRFLKKVEFYLDEFLRGDTGTSPARKRRAK